MRALLHGQHKKYGMHFHDEQCGLCIWQTFQPCKLSADAPEPPLSELQWTVAIARLLFGPAMNIQAPPNLTPAAGAAR